MIVQSIKSCEICWKFEISNNTVLKMHQPFQAMITHSTTSTTNNYIHIIVWCFYRWKIWCPFTTSSCMCEMWTDNKQSHAAWITPQLSINDDIVASSFRDNGGFSPISFGNKSFGHSLIFHQLLMVIHLQVELSNHNMVN